MMNQNMANTPFLERLFALQENQSSVRQELLGGFTTFLTMAYIVVVNPQILSQAGVPAEGVVFATCVSAAVASLVMGIYANYPIALAPGMSLNAYFTYTVVLGMHVPWQTALGAVFCSGVLFVLLTVTKVREQIVNGIPHGLKHATAGGIGMFIAFVGLRSAKLVVANPATFVSLGNFADPVVQAACVGIVLILALMVRKVKGAILIGILGTTLFGMARGLAHWPGHVLALPHASSTFLRLDLKGALHLGLVEIIFIFLFVDLFDNVGTMVGVCEQGGFVKDGKIPRVGKALLADGIGTVFGALSGTSTVTSYIEQRYGGGTFFGCDVFFAGRGGDSRVCDGPGPDSGGRIDDGIHCAGGLERVYGSVSGLCDAGGDTADVQHRDGVELGRDHLHDCESGGREIQRSERSAVGADRAVHCALCVFGGGIRKADHALFEPAV
jgi:adenine/guanine/hypoxanthine permease